MSVSREELRQQTQTLLYSPESEARGIYGNCFQAAVASLLELPLEAVPHFVQFTWWQPAVELWARGRGLTYVEQPTTEIPQRDCIVGGLSPRGVHHVVIARAGSVVWDPHPSRSGLDTIEDVAWFDPWPNDVRTCWTCGQERLRSVLSEPTPEPLEQPT